jgi:hypothetical protein
MGDELPPLGPVKAWLVKDFPVSLREDITRAAAGQGVTVGAWLVAHFQKHGVGGVEITRVYPTPVNLGNGPGTATPADELADLIRMARDATPDGKDSEAMKEARRVVLERLRPLRAIGREPAAPKRLTGPARDGNGAARLAGGRTDADPEQPDGLPHSA